MRMKQKAKKKKKPKCYEFFTIFHSFTQTEHLSIIGLAISQEAVQ